MNQPDAAPAAEPALPTMRVEFIANWFGLPKVLTLEVEHENIDEKELDEALKKLDGVIKRSDLGCMVDEASLMGICRWMARRMYKLLNGRTGRITVLWKPEVVTLDSKVVVSPGQA